MRAGEKHPYDPANTKLATNFKVSDYFEARDSENRATIAQAIQRRFEERYLNPISGKNIHGFTIMAVSCLMIESLESFYQGLETTKGKSRDAFCSFFRHAKQFSAFGGYGHDFYEHVRCGILHQAETTGGWRIRRGAIPLFNSEDLTVNSQLFVKALRQYLEGFCKKLGSSPWEGDLWKKVRKKMEAIAQNCQ